MKTYTVTLHMNNGDYLYLNDMCAKDDDELLRILMFDTNNTVPLSNKFSRALQGDHVVCYCVGQISSIHYKEKE